MKFLFLYSQTHNVLTGGIKYDRELHDMLKSVDGFEVDRIYLDNARGPGLLGKIKRHTAWLRNLRLLGKCRRYDWVVTNSVDGMFFIPLAVLLRATRTRFTTIHHHFEFHTLTGWRRKWLEFLEKTFLKVSRPPVVVSPYVLDQCRRYFPGKQFFYWQIPFKAPESTFSPAPVPGRLLFIGNIEPRKGLIHLIGAMAVLKKRGIDVSLTAIGNRLDRAYCNRIDEIIAHEGLKVDFPGFVSAEEKDRLTAEADIFAFPSLYEGYGMVICESLRRGLPAVVFDNSAMPFTVKDGVNGLVVPTADVTAYADAIGRVVTDRDLRARLSAGALATEFVTPETYRSRVLDDLAASR